MSVEKVVLLLGRRDEPTDGAADVKWHHFSILGVTQELDGEFLRRLVECDIQARRRIDFERANSFGRHASKNEIGIHSAMQVTAKKMPPRNHL